MIQDSIDIEKENEEGNIIPLPFSSNNISWMSTPQQKIYEVLSKEENRKLNYKEIITLAGYKNAYVWYKVLNDKKYRELIENMGVKTRINKLVNPHSDVIYIEDSFERNKYLDMDEWDMRKLYSDYPRHTSPSAFMVYFNSIENINIRRIVKRYFKSMISKWESVSFSWYLRRMNCFLKVMFSEFPEINNFSDLNREIHIEKILDSMNCSAQSKRESLFCVRSMFTYMYENKWDEGPTTNSLIISNDIPSPERAKPRPIPPYIIRRLDDYIINIIVPLLEAERETPFISPQYWDFVIILRYSGRRCEDIAHAIADVDKKIDCLRYDNDGDPQLFLDHRIAKIPKDLIIPLAHLKNTTPNGNIIERAILRQKKRVKNLPSTKDGYKYLFREIKYNCSGKGSPKLILDNKGNNVIEVIPYSKCYSVLQHICNGILLLNSDGSVYNITPHQFRHTVATEMIDAGVDIYAIKEFLGHNSILMTEAYILVYKETIRKEYEKFKIATEAVEVEKNLPQVEELYDNKWVKNKIIAVFDLGDGCCEHLYKIPSCPMMECKTCIRKKIYPRHIDAVKETIESFTAHRDNAIKLSLSKKIKEYDNIVKFYTIALEIIDKNEVFYAERDFYGKGGLNNEKSKS